MSQGSLIYKIPVVTSEKRKPAIWIPNSGEWRRFIAEYPLKIDRQCLLHLRTLNLTFPKFQRNIPIFFILSHIQPAGAFPLLRSFKRTPPEGEASGFSF